MEIVIIICAMVVMMWFMSRNAKKMQAQQREQRESAIELNKTVVTTSGYIGQIVDIDGDTVTLASPSGDETVWLRHAISAQMDYPFEPIEDDAEALTDDTENAAEDAPARDPKDTEAHAPQIHTLEGEKDGDDEKPYSAWK